MSFARQVAVAELIQSLRAAPESVVSGSPSGTPLLPKPTQGFQGRWVPPSRREQTAIDLIAREGDIDPRMAAWALTSTTEAYSLDAIERVSDGRYRGERVAVLLAETVPVAPLRAIVLPYLAGAREIVVRPPRSAPAFTRLVADELARLDPMSPVILDDAPGTEFVASLATRGTDRLIAFGSDATIDTLIETAPDGVAVEGHGHGFGVVVLSERAALGATAALALARDIVAYEQRGCLSPQCVFVHGSDARPTAEALHLALEAITQTWPAPPVPPDAALGLHAWAGAIGAASHAVYRASPAHQGRLFGGSDHVVAALEETRLASSPGHRRIAVVPFADLDALRRAIAGNERYITVVASDRDAPLVPLPDPVRRVELGAMQTPPLDGWEDPRPPTITRR